MSEGEENYRDVKNEEDGVGVREGVTERGTGPRQGREDRRGFVFSQSAAVKHKLYMNRAEYAYRFFFGERPRARRV